MRYLGGPTVLIRVPIGGGRWAESELEQRSLVWARAGAKDAGIPGDWKGNATSFHEASGKYQSCPGLGFRTPEV